MLVTKMAEKDWISRYFAPIATSGARNMQDDAGLLKSSEAWQIATTDALVEGVHFLPDQSIESVARKLVRVNVSDVLAKGAHPIEALLTLGWSEARSESELAAFAGALKDACEDWNIGLVGGDTVTSPVFFVSLTLLAGPLSDRAEPVWQSGAQIGDSILLTGKIGGKIGLEDAREGRFTPAARHYLEPSLPPLESAALLSRHANAATDVSDGLLGDLSGLLRRSSCGGELRLDAIRLWRESGDVAEVLSQCTGGDDYQIVCTAAPDDAKPLIESGIFYQIGRVVAGGDLTLSFHGKPVNLPETLGFEHGG